ncbi:MAG TPA: DUF2892 domain-containing protein [Thiomicrospira sp.]|jgi:hypothetical protein|nr:DUF2892 domain-containing protein [Thiomicrospira sp.]
MYCNVGGIDRILRVSVGVALIAWAILAGNQLGWLGLIPLLTGVFKFCPFYPLIGLKTCKTETKQTETSDKND